MLMLFFGSAAQPACAAAVAKVLSNRSMFDDDRGCFFGITADPSDESNGRIAQQLPGIRFFLDYDLAISRKFGACEGDFYKPYWLVLDRQLRAIGKFGLAHAESAFACFSAMAEASTDDGFAPVLVAPRIFEPELCRRLIALYEATCGQESGFMRDVEGKTVHVVDPRQKRRADVRIEDEVLRNALRQCVSRRLVPMIERAFQFRATRMERYVIACYDSAARGHFRAHRDNTTKGTAHRRFAVSINLNAEEFEGGDLCFPEFGQRLYRPPTGGAVVFSCSLLHEGKPVIRGRRFAFLPFLYDDAAAAQREHNNPYLDDSVPAYRKEHF